MKKLVSELSEQEINYLVAKAEGHDIDLSDDVTYIKVYHPAHSWKYDRELFEPCNKPNQAWPIIAKNHMTVACFDDEPAAWDNRNGIVGGVWHGANGLIAAMRCRIAMVYGDSVEVDDE